MTPRDPAGTPPPPASKGYEKVFMDGLNSIYNFVGDSAESMAASYLNSGGTLDEKVDSLIRWEASKSAVVGFSCSFGGIAMMPLSR